LTADAAHALRAPITAIKLQLEAMSNSNDINEIEDSGLGIALDEMKRVFDRFYRSENHIIIGSWLSNC
jgi:signal transduction histidine kinase